MMKFNAKNKFESFFRALPVVHTINGYKEITYLRKVKGWTWPDITGCPRFDLETRIDSEMLQPRGSIRGGQGTGRHVGGPPTTVSSAAANCHMQPCYVKYLPAHWTKERSRTKEEGGKPSCVNYGQNNAVNYKECPKATNVVYKKMHMTDKCQSVCAILPPTKNYTK
ncbi:hypothetical protein EVAR_97867_1 [Eumeta japonica]|uniref:Uncharacterized protein n=1 Tax=Eumeta variegata TaxID=151549 RepID=A0A4C1WZZ6_EUMVA|nr:hypothetical protein EVAR_97867_1 [Eumeta japonica]